LRNLTTDRAVVLSNVLERVAANFNSSVFTSHYFPNPFAPGVFMYLWHGVDARFM
jgi:hypothetical protein